MPRRHTSSRFQRWLSMKENFENIIDRDDRGWTLLHVAARKGDLAEVRRLLDEGQDVNVLSSGFKTPGITPLHLAAKGGHLEVMDELLERGANIEARTKGGCGWTPLHSAAKEKNKKSIRFLVESGAFLPPDIDDGRFNPPLHYCPGLEWAYKVKENTLRKQTSVDNGDDGEASGGN
eukprot:c23204_g1_i1 orf=368-898(-)